MTDTRTDLRRLVLLTFAQMLPATLVVPAIRPLFAALHADSEGAMHAFMSVNMMGAAVMAPLVALWADRSTHPYRILALLAAMDALLLFAVATAAPTPVILALRTLEGGAHVGAASILLAQASRIARDGGTGRTMGLAGAAITFAIVLGSAAGGVLVELDVRAPFWVGSAISATVAALVLSPRMPSVRAAPPRQRRELLGLLRSCRALWVPVSAAFVGRFTIGCLVVTFALFAHRVHDLSDGAVGWLFALMTLPFAVATYPASRLADRVPSAAVIAVGAAAYAIALGVLGRVPAAGLPAVMVTAGVASGMIFAIVLYQTSRMAAPSDRTRAMALVNVAGCVGMVAGPIVAGIVSAVANRAGDPVAGYRTVFLVAAGSLVAWLVLAGRWLVARYRDESVELAPAPTPHLGDVERT